MSYKGNRNVTYVKPEVPKFLREIKERIGYQPPPDVNAKRTCPPECSDEPDVERPDELPAVVSLKPGDLTAEEAEKARLQQEEEEGRKKIEKGEIKFRKPQSKMLPPKAAEAKRSGSDLPEREHKQIRRDVSKTVEEASSTKATPCWPPPTIPLFAHVTKTVAIVSTCIQIRHGYALTFVSTNFALLLAYKCCRPHSDWSCDVALDEEYFPIVQQ
uniref:DUF4604 domain-containing protein n=1 Tax=Trichuris muris TaxID=70415 RepID=A0A5S6QAW1_TRIMR